MRPIVLALALLVLAGCSATGSAPAATPTRQFVYGTPAQSERPAATPVDTGAWVVSGVGKDPITGNPIASATLTAESGESRFGADIVLAVRCREGATDVLILWETFLTTEDGQLVTTRLAGGTPDNTRWHTSTDHTVTLFPGTLGAVRLVKEMFGMTEFVARTEPHGDSPLTAVFDIYGVENAVREVRATCGW